MFPPQWLWLCLQPREPLSGCPWAGAHGGSLCCLQKEEGPLLLWKMSSKMPWKMSAIYLSCVYLGFGKGQRHRRHRKVLCYLICRSLKALHSAHSLAEKQQCSFSGGFTLGFTEQFTHCPYAAVSAATRQPALSDAEKYKRVSLKSILCQDQLRNDTTLFIYFIF